MAIKATILVSLLLVSIAGVAKVADGQLGLISGLLGLIRIRGTIFCTVNGNMGVNGTSTPIFPNASVQLRCGGNTVSSATTNALGRFSILLDPLQFIVSSIVSNCVVAVVTPLTACNAALPSIRLPLSPLRFIGSTVSGLLNVIDVITTSFPLI